MVKRVDQYDVAGLLFNKGGVQLSAMGNSAASISGYFLGRIESPSVVLVREIFLGFEGKKREASQPPLLLTENTRGANAVEKI